MNNLRSRIYSILLREVIARLHLTDNTTYHGGDRADHHISYVTTMRRSESVIHVYRENIKHKHYV